MSYTTQRRARPGQHENPDVVYICRSGENEELRYSLRSLVNLPHRRVWIFGDAPRWVNRQTVRVAKVIQSGNVYDITNRNIRLACERPGVSDPFVLFNDDFYVMQPIKTVPVLNRGTVEDVLLEHRGINSVYVKGMIETRDMLRSIGYRSPLSFELHVPLPVHKAAMLAAIALRGNIYRYHNRTAYGAIAGLTGRTIPDVKVYEKGDQVKGIWLSSNDATFPLVKPTLEAMFPTPSMYEVAA